MMEYMLTIHYSQPKTYLVQERLRVETIPVNPWTWLRKIYSITDDELKLKCGIDGYLFIRFIRAMIIIFLPLMFIIVTILLPVNYHGGKNNGSFDVGGQVQHFNVTGLDTLSWQNVAPTETDRYWAHLVCALLAISWTLYRIYHEKLHFIDVRQQFLTSPEHRLKASARTVLVTNIPKEYQSHEALKGLFDVFVDNDDRSRLHVWLNRDYKPLRALVKKRRKLCNALEREELKVLRLVNKDYRKEGGKDPDHDGSYQAAAEVDASEDDTETRMSNAYQQIDEAFEADCKESETFGLKHLKNSKEVQVTVVEDGAGGWKSRSKMGSKGASKTVPKAAWLRSEIARLTVQIEEMLPHLDKDARFIRQNSAFIQFDRQMAANSACGLITHHHPGNMAPRYLDVAPHEILWPNMGLTSVARFIRTCIALVLFVGMLFLWGIPATFLGILSQLAALRNSTSWLKWLQEWPNWIISLISGKVAPSDSRFVILISFRSWFCNPTGSADPTRGSCTVSQACGSSRSAYPQQA